MPHKKLITKAFQRYWRFSRGLSLDVRMCAFDAAGAVLLVRDTAHASWRLPGGGVAKGETAAQAAKRWLLREARLELTCEPKLVSVHSGQEAHHSDQTALYLVLNWRDAADQEGEGLTRAFFAPGCLPHGVDAATLNWLSDANEARATPAVW